MLDVILTAPTATRRSEAPTSVRPTGGNPAPSSVTFALVIIDRDGSDMYSISNESFEFNRLSN
jgi:hypothetical protein